MDTKLVKIDRMIIAGFSVETTLGNNDKDTESLYNDFIHNGKMEMLNSIAKNKAEYYGVIWYTKLHERYKYLLGQKVNELLNENNIEIKIITEGEYCYKKFHQEYDVIKAWTEFYYKGIR